jgi:hypothetical protein
MSFRKPYIRPWNPRTETLLYPKNKCGHGGKDEKKCTPDVENYRHMEIQFRRMAGTLPTGLLVLINVDR